MTESGPMLSVPPQPKSLLPPRWWWIALCVILLLAGALRFTGYNFSLPYVDHPDEPHFNLAARMIVDFGSPKPARMQGYPPGIIAVNYVLIRLFHDPTKPPSTILWMVRLISISFNLLSIALIALLGYRLMNPMAGLLGALLATVTPQFVEFSRYATADNFVMAFTLLGLFLALTAALYDRDGMARWAVVSMMAAIAFKYQALFVLPLVLVLPLWRLLGATGPARRRVIRHFLGSVGWLAAFGFWLVLLYPSTEASEVPNWVAGSMGVPGPKILYDNFRMMFDPLRMAIPALLALIGLIYLLVTRSKSLSWFACLAVLLAGLMWHVGVSFGGDQQYRQFPLEAALLTVLIGVGLSGWSSAFRRVLKRLPDRSPLHQRRAFLSGTIALIALALLSLPQINASVANAYQHTLPDRRNDLARYMDTSLTPAPFIADIDNHKTLDGAYGGYAGAKSFDFKGVAHLDDKPISEWQSEGVVYAIDSYGYYQDLQQTSAGKELLAQTLLLKTYLPSPDVRGPSMVVLRLGAIQHPADGVLGPIHLIGYDLDKASVPPGDSFNLTYYWRADAVTDADYVVYNHLIDSSGALVAQIDGDPLPDLRRPTSTWNDPAETLISRPFTLTVPAGTKPGTYSLITGFYRRDTGVRLLTADSHDSLTVTTITVR